MGYLNKVLLIGRLGQDPESRNTPSGAKVVNISLATTEHYKDQQGNKQEKTEWHRVVFWNRQAELAEQYLKKGSAVYVEGSLQTREWQDKDGNRRFSTDIVARNMQFLDSKPVNGQSNNSQTNYGYGGYGQQNPTYQPAAQIAPPVSTGNDFQPDDIPF